MSECTRNTLSQMNSALRTFLLCVVTSKVLTLNSDTTIIPAFVQVAKLILRLICGATTNHSGGNNISDAIDPQGKGAKGSGYNPYTTKGLIVHSNVEAHNIIFSDSFLEKLPNRSPRYKRREGICNRLYSKSAVFDSDALHSPARHGENSSAGWKPRAHAHSIDRSGASTQHLFLCRLFGSTPKEKEH